MLKCKKCGKTSLSTILNDGFCSECYKEFQRQEATKLEEYRRKKAEAAEAEKKAIQSGKDAAHHLYYDITGLLKQLHEGFPEYHILRVSGDIDLMNKYVELCQELARSLRSALSSSYFLEEYPLLHVRHSFGETTFGSERSSEEYLTSMVNFYSGRLKAAKARRDQMAEFARILVTLPAAEIQISEAPVKDPDKPIEQFSYSNITTRTPRDKLGSFVAIDVETTGLSLRSSIIEIAAIRFRNFEPVEQFSTLCKPKRPIPAEATAVNGISNDMVDGKPAFEQISLALQEFIGSDNLVGHNLPFDIGFIQKYGVDLSAHKRKYYDTLGIAKRTLKKEREGSDAYFDVSDYKLATLCEYYQIPLFGAHRALADCYAAGKLLQCLAKDRE